jgi:O-antigen/teichoic acid export membrane protein
VTSGSSTADILSLEPVHAELRKRSVRSGLNAAAGRVAQGVISLGSVAVLARMLTPSDFGVIAMVLPITPVATMTMHRGLHFALLHAERLDTRQVSRLYWIAMRYNLVLLGGMALLGPVLAAVYREPRVALVTAIWAGSLAVQSLGTFHEMLLKRQLRFGILTMVSVSGMLAGAIVAIAAAASGAGHLALLLQWVTWDAVRSAGAWSVSRWRPDPREWSGADESVVTHLSEYGRHFTMNRGVYWAGRQADRMVVGFVAGAGPLGLYDSARRWSWYAFHELFQSLTDVMVASLSRARADVERFREFCREGLMAFLIPPLAVIAFIFIEADAAVRVLLGERWLEAIPLVRIMCGAAFCDALSRLTMWLYTAEGRTRQQFHWSLTSTPIMLLAIGIGAMRGVNGVAWAFAGATAALMIPTVTFCLRGSAIRGRDFIALAWRPVTASGTAALLLTLAHPILPARDQLPGFLLAAATFVFFYVVTWLALPGGVLATRKLRDGVTHAFAGDPS